MSRPGINKRAHVVVPEPTLTKALQTLTKLPAPVQAFSSEPSKWRHLVVPFVQGNVVEVATGGDPVYQPCVQIELTPASYARYNNNQPLRGPVQWRSDDALFNLPFKDGTVDTFISSHILEDYLDWMPLLVEWTRVLRKGGRLIVCIPDKQRWDKAVAGGQCPNLSHRHEGYLGELSTYAPKLGLVVISERFTECPPGDYNIAFIGQKR